MIHQYKLGGYNIVLDVFSGSVHAVDEVAYDAIALIDGGSTRAQAAAALAQKYAGRDECDPRRHRGLPGRHRRTDEGGQAVRPPTLTPATPSTSRTVPMWVKGPVPARGPHLQPELQLPALRPRGKFHGEAGLMSFETGKQALDFLVAHSGTPAQPGGGLLRRANR